MGEKYSAQYVNILYTMVQRNLTLPYRFVCITDDHAEIRKEVECFDMPQLYVSNKHDSSPWRKLLMFSSHIGDLSGKTLFLDLDVVILDNIDCFFSYSEKFSIIENWTQPGEGIGNSSVYCFTIGAYSHVLEYYRHHTGEVLKQYDNEPIFLSKKIGDIVFWPAIWCRSFKRHCIAKGLARYVKAPVVPEGARVIVFHGHPNPDDAYDAKGYKWKKYTPAACWVKNYWYE